VLLLQLPAACNTQFHTFTACHVNATFNIHILLLLNFLSFFFNRTRLCNCFTDISTFLLQFFDRHRLPTTCTGIIRLRKRFLSLRIATTATAAVVVVEVELMLILWCIAPRESQRYPICMIRSFRPSYGKQKKSPTTIRKQMREVRVRKTFLQAFFLSVRLCRLVFFSLTLR